MASVLLLSILGSDAGNWKAAFEPRYDGTDRWLQRVIITDDLGRSADRRINHPRVVENELVGA